MCAMPPLSCLSILALATATLPIDRPRCAPFRVRRVRPARGVLAPSRRPQLATRHRDPVPLFPHRLNARRTASRNSTMTTRSTGSPISGSPASGSSTVTRRRRSATSGCAASMAPCKSSCSSNATNAWRCCGSTNSTGCNRSATSSGRCTANFSASMPGTGALDCWRDDVGLLFPIAVLGVSDFARVVLAWRWVMAVASGFGAGVVRRMGPDVLELLP